MAAATADIDLVDLDLDLYFNIDDFDVDVDVDVIQAKEDMDLSNPSPSAATAAEFGFHGGGDCCYSAVFSDADIVSHSRHVCNDDDDANDQALATLAWLLGNEDEEEPRSASSSPAYSGVTDDGTMASPAATGYDGGAEAMSAYVAELERLLFADDEQAEDVMVDAFLFGGEDDCFAGDELRLVANNDDDQVVVVTEEGGGGERTDDGSGSEVEDNGISGAGDGDFLAAREDQQSASRKRARYDDE